MPLQGSLSELSLPDVIQMVSVSGKTGVFEVVRSDEVGRIHLKDGLIVDAEVGSLRGDDAVYEMVIWSEGDFSFKPGAAPETTTIHLSNANLLMEAARRQRHRQDRADRTQCAGQAQLADQLVAVCGVLRQLATGDQYPHRDRTGNQQGRIRTGNRPGYDTDARWGDAQS